MIPRSLDPGAGNDGVLKITATAGHSEPAGHSLSPRLVTYWLCDLR